MSVTFHEPTSTDICFFCKDPIKHNKALISTDRAKRNSEFISLDLNCLQQLAQLVLELIHNKAWRPDVKEN